MTADRAPGGGTRRRRALLGVVDQLVFSLSNVSILLISARELSVAEFGSFALVMTAGLVTISIVRGLTSETLVVRFAGDDGAVRRSGLVASGGASLVTSGIAAVVFAVVGLMSGGLFGPCLLALAFALPGVAVQDSYRYAALVAKRPWAAIANDCSQTLVQFTILGALIVTDHGAPWAFVAAWGAGSYVAALAGGMALGVAPDPRRARSWFREQGDLASRYGLDNLIMAGSQNAGSITLGFVAPLAAVGAVRGTQTVFTPPSVLSAGVRSAVTPEVVRGIHAGRWRLSKDVRKLSWGLGAVSLAWGVVVLWMPDSLGKELLGPTWHNVKPLLPYFAFAQVLNGIWIGPMVGLRALGAANRMLVARLTANVFVVGGQIAGAVLGGALGVAIATAFARPVQVAIWWHHYSRAAREHFERGKSLHV